MTDKASEIRARLLAKIHKTATKHELPTGGIPYTTPENRQSVIAANTMEHERNEIVYNEQQQEAIDTVLAGHSCLITGPAGSGKTATLKGIIAALMEAGRLHPLGAEAGDHKHLRPTSPSLVVTSFTNKAVQNTKKVLSKDLHSNCLTLHKLLEYGPVFDEHYDEVTGTMKNTMRFEPKRDAMTPLPSINVVFIDEATMVGVDLWNNFALAAKLGTQIVLVGDIHQLPPIFGKSIFIWATQLGIKCVELTHIYRQALESPIIALATRIREGKQIPPKELDSFNIETSKGKVQIRPWKKKLSDIAATATIKKFLTELIDSGAYDPTQDVILTPFNKSFGTIAMNEAVASHLAKIETNPDKRMVHEIYAGIKKKYLRLGDKVLVNKSEAFVVSIAPNRSYYGKKPRPPSDTMNYEGFETDENKRLDWAASQARHTGMESLDSVDHMLEHLTSHTKDDERVAREASHIVTVYVPDLDTEQSYSSSGEINAMDLAYAITVHKSQGSEYDKVFFITHASQSNMLCRELLYTAVTRAAKELYIICEPNMFLKGIVSQRVPGKDLAEKVAEFERQLQLTKQGTMEIPLKPELLTS